jgi:pimeloyl-ACP methyl ester carboxylesterase
MRGPEPRLVLEQVLVGPADAARTCLLVHDAEGRPDHLLDFAGALTGRRLIIPRAPRWASLRGEGLYNWFTTPGRGQVDPVGFGDSLAQLELLLLSLGEEPASAPVGAVGFGQGASMAAALAALWPERFAWLVLVGGFWPQLPDDLLPARPMLGLPVLAIPDGNGGTFEIDILAGRGAQVVAEQPAETLAPASIGQWIAAIERTEEAR